MAKLEHEAFPPKTGSCRNPIGVGIAIGIDPDADSDSDPERYTLLRHMLRRKGLRTSPALLHLKTASTGSWSLTRRLGMLGSGL